MGYKIQNTWGRRRGIQVKGHRADQETKHRARTPGQRQRGVYHEKPYW